MSRYIITISTTAYKPMQANEKCWERGTVNDFMEALNGYKVTITIEGAEEEETMDFYIEAESFEEAVENVRNDLDI